VTVMYSSIRKHRRNSLLLLLYRAASLLLQAPHLQVRSSSPIKYQPVLLLEKLNPTTTVAVLIPTNRT